MSDQELHDQLRDYYGTAMMNGNPMAMMELEQAERASGEELRRMAAAAGITESAPESAHEPESAASPLDDFTPIATFAVTVAKPHPTESGASASIDAQVYTQNPDAIQVNEEATAKFRKLIQYFSDKVAADEARFESEGGILERHASRTNITSAAQLADIMAESERITRQLYFDYETTAAALDQACDQVLTSDLDPEALGEVADLLAHVNSECSTLGSNYSATIGANSLGNVVSTRFSPSSSALAAEARWRTRYLTHPLIIKRKAEEDRIAEEQRKVQEAEKAAAAARYVDEYPALHAAWQEECKRVEAQRRDEYDRRLKKKSEELTLRFERNMPAKIAEAKQKIAAVDKAIEEVRAERAALSKFKISEQLQLKAKEDALQRDRKFAEEDLQRETAYLQAAHEKLDAELKDLPDLIRREVNRDLRLPREPRDPNTPAPDLSKMNATQRANWKYKEAILEYMDDGKSHTVSDVSEWCGGVQDLSLQRVGAIMRSMELEGLLSKETVNNYVYYTLV